MSARTVRRAADRAMMAEEIQALARRHGCAAAIESATWRGPRCLAVVLGAPGGLSVTINFDGESTQPDTYVIAWHIRALHGEVKLAHSFGQVNPHHQQKATHVAEGYAALYAEVDRALTLAADGTAYEVQA